ncbi:MAG: hypothetical protein CR974_02010 [Gammaproteobacteria bacterium]|nr:MAG: hypothetical protein CR974_02010 [Gammaproteobacteria bacterium]
MFSSLFQLEQIPVTLFSSADADAPVLTAEAGSLKSLLKACLVTGYGDKQSLGWQMAHQSDDQLSAAFKSAAPDASGFYLKVDNSAGDKAKLSAYQTMSDIDTGAKAWVENQEYDLVASEWRLIGHKKAFVLLLDLSFDNGERPYAYPLLFGDLPRETKRVNPVCVLWSGRRSQYHSASLQVVLQEHPNGKSSDSASDYFEYAPSRPVRINSGSRGENLINNSCLFGYESDNQAAGIYSPVLSALSDGTWTFLPMLQPLSAGLSDVANFGRINDNTIKATTGAHIDRDAKCEDCAVPTDFWWG